MASGEIKISERVQPGDGFNKAFTVSLAIGGIAFLLAVLIGYFSEHSLKRFYHAYLVSYCYFLSIGLGALFFVLLQHATRAGWSVGVRRVAENFAATMPVLGVLSAPILLAVVLQRGELYAWADREHAEVASHEISSSAGVAAEPPATNRATSEIETHEGHPNAALEEEEAEIVAAKHPYLNPSFFVLRMVVYFVIWSGISIWYRRLSLNQDGSGDLNLTNRMEAAAPVSLIILALTLTLASFDLLLSVDATWYSTMFGVYYFAGSAVAIFAVLIISLTLLQRAGYLTESITTEHYHDLGKFLFAFVFFWGYIAFSQYMLTWYAAIPEEVGWYARRGASTIHEHVSSWSVVALLVLFGHLLIPFAGLLSRHVKRTHVTLVFWAVWMLVFHWVDLYWIVMPQMWSTFHLGIVEILCVVGIGGLYLAGVIRTAGQYNLRPVADPRLIDSFAFQNI